MSSRLCCGVPTPELLSHRRDLSCKAMEGIEANGVYAAAYTAMGKAESESRIAVAVNSAVTSPGRVGIYRVLRGVGGV